MIIDKDGDREVAEDMLKAVFESLPKTKRDEYVFEDCLNAYNLYLSFIRRRFSLTPDIKIEKMNELFHLRGINLYDFILDILDTSRTP